MNTASNCFRFLKSIFKERDLDDAVDYSPTIQTDYGEEIRIDCTKAEFVLENMIFHKDVRINIKTPCSIKIRNCVFSGSLSLYPDSEELIETLYLFCYKIQVARHLSLVREAAYKEAIIDSCAMKALIITDLLIGKLDIFNTEVCNDIYLEGTHIKDLVVHGCYINIIRHYFLEVTAIDIDIDSFTSYHKSIISMSPKQFIDYDKIDEANMEIRSLRDDLPNYASYGKTKKEFKAIIKHNTKILMESINDQKRNAVKHFLKFISLMKKSKHESVDTQVLAELNYKYYRHKQYNPLIFVGLWMLGFFFKPFRLVFTSLFVILTFAVLFYLVSHTGDSILTFDELRSGSVMKSVIMDFNSFFYFSVITFYTIGFSDLPYKPNTLNAIIVIKQYLVFAEALVGVFVNSSIIISLMNRYGIKD